MEIDNRDSKVFNDLSQKIAEAIESVLKIDVTIMNDEKVRIAGTGKYKLCLFEEIEKNTVFDFCLNTGKEYIVEEARKSEICKKCSKIDRCNEKGEICVPIRYKDTVIGVIGVIAFNDNQKKEIVQNKYKYVNFMQKMASLLEAKYSERLMSRENTILSSRLNNILNTMMDAIIVYNNKGHAIYKNLAFTTLLNNLGIKEYDDFLIKIWEYIKNKQLNLLDSEHKEISIEHYGENHSFLADITLLKDNKYSNEIIVSLKDYKKVQMKIMQKSEKNQIRVQFNNILSISSELSEIKKIARKAAFSESNVLISGESGTGKEMFARSIHNCSLRKENAFIPINCGAIPDALLESELFGYEKGAFTGATNTKIGKFEIADNGTIFLDEISEMPFRLQVKLLRVLQEREICRVGSNKLKKINVRIIAATNANLKERIEGRLFREDLYYRLNIIPIKIPPLRDRINDIEYIANYYIEYYNEMFNKAIKPLSKNVVKIFEEYKWPGNVRELQNVIEFAVNFEAESEIEEELIIKRLGLEENNKKINSLDKKKINDISLNNNIDFIEKEIIENKIEEYKGIKHKDIIKKVCIDLKISRSTFYRKLKKYNILFPY